MKPAPSLARGTFLNVIGQGVPLLVGVASIPIISARLGEVRFGFLGLLWGVLGYFSVLDLGMGRATTKFVAEHLARGRRHSVEYLVGMSALLQTALGALGGLALALGTPLLVGAVLKVPAYFAAEARSALFLLALSLPFVLLSLALRAVLEAAQRFDLVNLIRLPSSVSTFVLPACGALLGMRLPGIVLLLLAARVATCVATAWAIGAAIRGFRWRRPTFRLARLRPLLAYSGWVAVSNFIGPMLVYFDRYALGSIAGMAAVAYYTGPYEAVTRLLILPAAMAAAFFPAFSTIAARGDVVQGPSLLARGAKHLLLMVAMPSAILVLFAHDLLAAWLGPIYAAQGAAALQLLSLGVLMNALAHLPHSYLQAIGRADVTAKLHVAELAPYAVVAWWLIARFGITGAALAWTLRALVDAILLFGLTGKVLRVSPVALAGGVGVRTFVALGSFGAVLTTAGLLIDRTTALVGLAGLTTVTFAAASWRFVLDANERSAFLSAIRVKAGS